MPESYFIPASVDPKHDAEPAAISAITPETIVKMTPENRQLFIENVGVEQLNELIPEMTDEQKDLIRGLVAQRPDNTEIRF